MSGPLEVDPDDVAIPAQLFGYAVETSWVSSPLEAPEDAIRHQWRRLFDLMTPWWLDLNQMMYYSGEPRFSTG